MNHLLNDLEKITDFSEGQPNPRNSLTICNKCILRNSPYALCFYRTRLNSTCLNSSQQATTLAPYVKIMLVSRDPNIDPDISFRFSNNLTRFIATYWRNPQQQNIQRFFYDFLLNNNVWAQFINYLEDTKNNPIPKFYWTHLVKCYAQNNPSLVKKAAKFCIEYLREEIKCIDPVLIIALGKDAGKGVYKVKSLSFPRNYKLSDLSPKNEKTIKQRKGIVVIPHSSGRNPYYDPWKNGEYPIGVTFDELKNLIDSLI